MHPINRIFALAIMCVLSLAGSALAQEEPRTVLFEDPALGAGRLHYPLLITEGRGYRIVCASEADEEAVIRGLGFASVPSQVLTAVDPDIVAARPDENPLLCPSAPDFVIKIFAHQSPSGLTHYLQFPSGFGAATFADRLYIPGCAGLVDALGLDMSQALNADPTPFFVGKIHKLACLTGDPLVVEPQTFADWCMKGDRRPEETATVMAVLDATPGGVSALGVSAACSSADTFLRAIRTLNLNGRNVQSVAPISALSHLTSLSLANNEISSIDKLTGMTALTFLDLSGNRINNVAALAPLTALTRLNLADNELTHIRPLSALMLLTSLTLDGNRIDDLSPLQFQQTLTTLSLANNGLTGAMIEPLTGLSALTELDLSDNQIADFEFLAAFPSTVSIDLSGNPVVASGGQTFLDACILHRDAATPYGQTIRTLLTVAADGACAAGNAALLATTTLDLSSKILSDIRPLALLPHLTGLNLSGNAITDVSALAGLTALRELNLADNDIRDIRPVAPLVDLTEFDASGNPIELTDFLSACLMRAHEGVLSHEREVEVEKLLTVSGAVSCFAAEADLKQRVIVDASNAGLTSLEYFGLLEKVTSLDLSGNGLSEVSALERNPRLTHLLLRGNNLGSLASLRRLRGLEVLGLEENPLTSLIGLGDLADLRRLGLSGSAVRSVLPLEDLPLLENASLRNLSLNYTSLREFCIVNRFDPISLGSARPFMAAIDTLLEGAQVDRGNCDAVETWAATVTVLNLNKKQISSVEPIVFFTALRELHLFDNLITDAGPIASLRNLVKLNLATNRISVLPRMASGGLSELYINDNLISEISSVTNLPSLQTFGAVNNRITDLTPLGAIGGIGSIDVRGNRVQTNAHYVESQLRKMYLADNPICGSPFTMHPEVQAACSRRHHWVVDRGVVLNNDIRVLAREDVCPNRVCAEIRVRPNTLIHR